MPQIMELIIIFGGPAVVRSFFVALSVNYLTNCCIHQTLRVTPAMEAGIAEHVWVLDEIIALLD
jgi:hypothetical protein